VKLTDDVRQRKQKHFKQYRTAKQKLTNKENPDNEERKMANVKLGK